MIQTLPAVRQQRFLVRYARPRRLGSLFIPLRRLYLFVIPMLLFSGAMFAWAAGSDFAMISGAVILSVVSLYMLYDLVGRRGPLRVSTTLAITLGLAYGLGTVNTWFTLPRGDADLGEFLHRSPLGLAHAMGSILASLALIVCLGELFEQPIFGEEFELKFNNRVLVFLTIGSAALAASFLRGSTSFMGASIGEGADRGHLGYLASLSEWLAAPLLALCVCVSLNITGRFRRLYTKILSVALFVMIFPLGRRIMIFSVLLSMVALRLGRYRIPFSPLKKIVLLALLGGGIYFASVGFFYLRVAGYGLVKPTLFERVNAAFELSKQRSYADIQLDFSKGVQTRTFVLGFIGDLEGFTDTMDTAHGEDLISQFQLALPSLLFPGKDIFFSEEGLANRLFGSSYTDEANSVYSAGIIDYGVFGLLLYPLCIILMLRVFIEVLMSIMPVFACCFVVLATLASILEPETALDAYFLIERNGILFVSVVLMVMSLPEFRIRNVGL